MLDTVKKCVFYFNAATLTFSYLLLSVWFSVFALQNAPDGLITILAKLKPVYFVLEFFNGIMHEVSGGILYLSALFLPIIVSILTPIFLRKELSKHTLRLLSFSFIFPFIILAAFVINDTVLDGYNVLAYFLCSIFSLIFLAYNITALVFMHRDEDELDW